MIFPGWSSPHLYNEPFRRLSRHPRLIEPARQVLGGPVYLHQFKINAKRAHDGEIWHWHQDYRTWLEDDGMPQPNIINAALFLDDVNEFNGPMMFIPGSHQAGRRDSTRGFERIPEYGRLAADAVSSPYSRETIDALIEEHGLVAPKGPAGSVVFFHGCTVHGSGPNMSPWNRTMVFASPNRVDNWIRKPTRPDFLALQDFTPVEPLDDDCLLWSQRSAVRPSGDGRRNCQRSDPADSAPASERCGEVSDSPRSRSAAVCPLPRTAISSFGPFSIGKLQR